MPLIPIAYYCYYKYVILLLILLFFLGACCGSFLNVLIDRIPRRESIFISRSHCEKCRKKIMFYDLIPVASYVLLSGKCRKCGAKIPFRIFLVEASGGLIFTLLFFFAFINPLQYILLCLISLILLTITVIDIEHGIIPDILLGGLGALGLLLMLTAPSSILSSILTGLLSFAFFFLIFAATRGRGMGFGDVKYAFFIGFLLPGWGAIIAFYLAFLTGAAISIILIVGRQKKLKGSTVPFGPFLSLGVFLALLFEKQILELVLVILRI